MVLLRIWLMISGIISWSGWATKQSLNQLQLSSITRPWGSWGQCGTFLGHGIPILALWTFLCGALETCMLTLTWLHIHIHIQICTYNMITLTIPMDLLCFQQVMETYNTEIAKNFATLALSAMSTPRLLFNNEKDIFPPDLVLSWSLKKCV